MCKTTSVKKKKPPPKETANELLQEIQDLISRDVAKIREMDGKLPRQEADDLASYGRFMLAVVESQEKKLEKNQKQITQMTTAELFEAIKDIEGVKPT